jgi:mycothiol synthase
VRTEVSDDEVAAVRRLSQRIDAADPDRSASPPVLPVLEAQSGLSRFAAALIRRPSDPAEVGAYAQAWREKTSGGWQVSLLVDPADEIDMLAVGAAAMHPVLAAVGDHGGGKVRWWVRRSSDEDGLLAERLGFDLAREVVQLRAPLPLAVEADGEVEPQTTDLVTRAFLPGQDDDEWLAVNAAAFADHPDQGALTAEDLKARRREPWFDPAGFLLHEDGDGAIDGFCWTKVHAEAAPPLGEIYVIGVRPDAAGRGLGRDLVVAGLTHLADKGLTTGMLWTEHDNEAARHLYEERLGFELHHVDRLHTAEVAPTEG